MAIIYENNKLHKLNSHLEIPFATETFKYFSVFRHFILLNWDLFQEINPEIVTVSFPVRLGRRTILLQNRGN